MKKDASQAQLNPKLGTTIWITPAKIDSAACALPVDILLGCLICFLVASLFIAFCSFQNCSFQICFTAIMAQPTRHHRALRERSRSRDDSHERQLPIWQPHPSTRGHEFRESCQQVPRPEQHRDILIFVDLRAIQDLMRQHHDNIMHWTSCDTLPLLGRQEEHALYTFSVLLTKERLVTFTVYNLLHMISRYIWTTWDRFLQPSSMDVRWTDETDDVFVLHEEDQLLDLLNFHRPHWTQGQEYGMIGRILFPNEQIRRFSSPNQPYIMRLSCHEALPNRNMLPWGKTKVAAALNFHLNHCCLLSPSCSFSKTFSPMALAVTWLNVTLLPLVSPLRPCRPMLIVANVLQSPMPTTSPRHNPHRLGHHIWPSHHLQLGLQPPSMQNKSHHIHRTSPPICTPDQLHPTPMIPPISPQFYQSKKRPYQTGTLYIMHQLHHGVNCMLSTSMKSANLVKTTILLLNVILW